MLSGAALLTLTSGVLGTKPALAADDSCNFNTKFAELRAIQADTSRGYLDAIRAELEVRKTILKGILDCALGDVKNRKDELQNIAPDFDGSNVKINIGQTLDASVSYYTKEQQIVDSLGIKGTKEVARDIAAWRDTNLNPAASREDDLLLWTADQPLFAKTAARFAQISPVVLSLSLINQKDVQAALADAETSFTTAQQGNDAAKTALLNQDLNASELIKASLEPLSSIYKKFLEISDMLKKIVP
jgi:hypothetical protein